MSPFEIDPFGKIVLGSPDIKESRMQPVHHEMPSVDEEAVSAEPDVSTTNVRHFPHNLGVVIVKELPKKLFNREE